MSALQLLHVTRMQHAQTTQVHLLVRVMLDMMGMDGLVAVSDLKIVSAVFKELIC